MILMTFWKSLISAFRRFSMLRERKSHSSVIQVELIISCRAVIAVVFLREITYNCT